MNFSIKNWYKVLITLFSLLFIGSVIFGYSDLQASYDEYKHLEFPAWLLHPLSVAKVLGVIAILKSKSQSIKDFAYAGFLFDLLCALGGHIAQHEIKIILPVVCIFLWFFTYRIDKKYHQSMLENY
jgi:hypothetical protein